MRVLFGIVLGSVLTVGGAYLYDARHTSAEAATTGTAIHRPLVNWDVVGRKWDRLTHRVRAEWGRIAG